MSRTCKRCGEDIGDGICLCGVPSFHGGIREFVIRIPVSDRGQVYITGQMPLTPDDIKTIHYEVDRWASCTSGTGCAGHMFGTMDQLKVADGIDPETGRPASDGRLAELKKEHGTPHKFPDIPPPTEEEMRQKRAAMHKRVYGLVSGPRNSAASDEIKADEPICVNVVGEQGR